MEERLDHTLRGREAHVSDFLFDFPVLISFSLAGGPFWVLIYEFFSKFDLFQEVVKELPGEVDQTGVRRRGKGLWLPSDSTLATDRYSKKLDLRSFCALSDTTVLVL